MLAGMQRGSSLRSHHKGGPAGSSRSCAPSLQPSADNRSQMQSAALTDAASSKSIEARASAWRGILMKAKSESTAPLGARNKSRAVQGQRGGETGGVGCRIVGEKSVQFGARFHPRRSWGERRAFRVYSNVEAGFATLSGKPGIACFSRRPRPWKPGDCSMARPTYRRL